MHPKKRPANVEPFPRRATMHTKQSIYLSPHRKITLLSSINPNSCWEPGGNNGGLLASQLHAASTRLFIAKEGTPCLRLPRFGRARTAGLLLVAANMFVCLNLHAEAFRVYAFDKPIDSRTARRGQIKNPIRNGRFWCGRKPTGLCRSSHV